MIKDLQDNIAERISHAGMDPAIFYVSLITALPAFRDEHLSGNEPAPAPSALSGTAVRLDDDTGTFDRLHQCLIGPAEDGLRRIPLPDRYPEKPAGSFRGILRIICRITVFTGKFKTDPPFREPEFRQFPMQIVIHRFRTADENRMIRIRDIFPDQLRCNETRLKTILHFIGEDMDDADFAAGTGNDRVKFFPQKDAVLGPAAVKDRKVEILRITAVLDSTY